MASGTAAQPALSGRLASPPATAGERRAWTGELSLLFPSFADALSPTVEAVAARVLAQAAVITHEARAAMLIAYQAAGLVTVSIPLPVPGHLPYDLDAPVGIAEVADRLGVERDTADHWRVRSVLPAPNWTVGGRPAWPWKVIEEWAARTGRLPR